MKNPVLQLTAGLALLITASANAQSQPTAATTPPKDWDTLSKEIKNPASWFTWGADLRLRNEYFNNALSYSHTDPLSEQDYYRYRERVWMSFLPTAGLSLNARMAGEQRHWTKTSYANQYARTGFEERYLIVDNLNVKYDNIANSGLSLGIGRQDIMFGEPLNWWLVADGTPADGSWTFFLDSARVAWDAKDIKTKFDLVYINQKALPDDRIGTIGRSSENRNPVAGPVYRPYYLTEQDEQGVILYASTKAVKNMQIDGYFIYKQDERISEIATGDDADIYTFGAKISGTPMDHLAYSLEGAYQFGNKEDMFFAKRDIDAFGLNGKLTYLFKDKYKNQISIVGEYLSGDDPATGDDEMFDVLWGRWPRWSELYIYSYVYETGGKVAQLNNLGRVGVNWTVAPTRKMTCSLTYNALFAPQEVPTRRLGGPSAYFSLDGNYRGDFLQAFVKYQFTKNMSGHLWGEFLWEGDYYTSDDLMTFVRAELMFTF